MTLITDDFGPVPERRVVSAAPASPQEEALERALRPQADQADGDHRKRPYQAQFGKEDGYF